MALFASPQMLSLLKQSQTIICDGTFKYAPGIAYQVDFLLSNFHSFCAKLCGESGWTYEEGISGVEVVVGWGIR